MKSKVIGQHCEKRASTGPIETAAKLTITDPRLGISRSLNNISYFLYSGVSQGANHVPCEKVPAPRDFLLLASTPKFEREKLFFGDYTVTVGALDLGTVGDKLNLDVIENGSSSMSLNLNSVQALEWSVYLTDGEKTCQDQSCEALRGILRK